MNSSISAGSKQEILCTKEQAGNFHDLQLYFPQPSLIPLLLEQAPSPELLCTS